METTSVESVFAAMDQVDDVMLAGIRPGWSGQALDPPCLRIEAVRHEIDRRGSTSTSRSTAG